MHLALTFLARALRPILRGSLLGGILLIGASVLTAQCPWPEAHTLLHGNEMRVAVPSGGALFHPFGQSSSILQPTTGSRPWPSTIFAQSLWLMGLDTAGQLKAATLRFNIASGSPARYVAGPIMSSTPYAEQCEGWDRVWSVSRHDVTAHLADLADNGQVDAPLAALMQWPGRGNPHFEEWAGFALPDAPDGLAPFFDADGDGIYDPLAGDYPAVEGLAQQPAQITWSIFNDWHRQYMLSLRMGVEVHRTLWAMNCEGDNLLNRTFFVRYKIINKGPSAVDSLWMGLWHDFDLGCESDDHLGSSPAHHAAFAYNSDPHDGTTGTACIGGVPTFGSYPPVQAVTVLNRPLDAFYTYNLSSLSIETTEQYYNVLRGRYPDGTPLTIAGQTTTLAFPGDPNNTSASSMMHTPGLPNSLGGGLCGMALGRLEPSQSVEVDIAYLFVQEPGLGHLQNVTAMYSQLDALRQLYAEGLAEGCMPLTCTEDCVWPGDANADGTADHEDLLAIGQALGQSGPSRGPFVQWAPLPAADWATPGLKHVDADGDGIVGSDDLTITQDHYGNIRPTYIPPPDTFPTGEELTLRPHTPNSFIDIEEGTTFLVYIDLAPVPGLKGLAFSVEYDPRYFKPVQTQQMNIAQLKFLRGSPTLHQVDFAWYRPAPGQFIAPTGSLGFFQIVVRDFFEEPLPPRNTRLRFKNIIGLAEDGTRIPIGGSDLMAEFRYLPLSDDEPPAAPSPVTLWPNPTEGKVWLSSPGRRVDRLSVISITGQTVWAQPNHFHESSSIDLSGLPPGLYVVRVEMEGAVVMRRVVKQ